MSDYTPPTFCLRCDNSTSLCMCSQRAIIDKDEYIDELKLLAESYRAILAEFVEDGLEQNQEEHIELWNKARKALEQK